MAIVYRKMKRHEIAKVVEIDRSDYSDMMYRVQNSKLVLAKSVFNHPGLKKSMYTPYIQDLRQTFDTGGILNGAFHDGSLIGISGIDKKLVGKYKNMINLCILWVSKEFRRKGIARKLLNLSRTEAKNRNVDRIYISATPSRNTVEFYQKMGCEVTEEIDPEMFEKEPEDVHLELKL